jgi:hypothetical protein
VHSSPYSCTIIKCVTLVRDLVPLHRLHNKSVTCTGFVLPKFGSNTCVTKVCVKWHRSKFTCNLLYVEDPTHVLGLIVEAVQKAIEVSPGPSSLRMICMGVINLLPEELTAFGGVIQIRSQQSILLGSESHIYKYPIGSRGSVTLFKASLFRLEHTIVVFPTLDESEPVHGDMDTVLYLTNVHKVSYAISSTRCSSHSHCFC